METDKNSNGFEDLLQEMRLLCYSANSQIMETFCQRKSSPDPATYIGSGKVKEIADAVVEEKPDLVIFMNDLKPTQQRNLSEKLKTKVVDRQGLILDIFAQRAKTKEGKMQVELALLNYLLPRLAGLGPVLSRLGGGIGTRGPGETMLETDRRHVMRRIETLRKDLNKVRSHRELLRTGRYNKGYLLAALAGYTNAGKSTLLNELAKREVAVEDKLFATLDPTVGKYYLGEGIEILLADTVGFIQNLPHQLTAAFKATLEEVQDADIILIVLDISHPLWKEQLKVTEKVLEEMACDNKPAIILLNKSDLVSESRLKEIQEEVPEGILVSALNKTGFDHISKSMINTVTKFFPNFAERFRRNDTYIPDKVFNTAKEPGK